MLNVERQKNGDFRVRMPVPALKFLHRLPGRLRAILRSRDFGDSAVRRLFPVAYKDSQKEEEYRRLLADDLTQRKLEALDVFERILTSCRVDFQEAAFTVPCKDFHAFLGVINDMRLVLGVELDITEEIWEKELDQDDPHGEKVLLLHFLSFLEESLLEATGMVDLNIRPEDVA